ncbi:uncharacterized protein LOC131944400 [Physella acuta]|uniref:uncharacterized protein LOC131944400 n=1 Tax=Physella acuta TaxID=109671 RepID=UPI0027DE4228|nr:uncharacterized protein LOC131944400 [Physella acuta]
MTYCTSPFLYRVNEYYTIHDAIEFLTADSPMNKWSRAMTSAVFVTKAESRVSVINKLVPIPDQWVTIAGVHSDDLVTDVHSDDLVTDVHSDDLVTDAPSDDLVTDVHSDALVTDVHSDDLVTDVHSDDLVTDAPSDDLVTYSTELYNPNFETMDPTHWSNPNWQN